MTEETTTARSPRSCGLTTVDLYNLDAACLLIVSAFGAEVCGGGDATPWQPRHGREGALG